MTELKIRLEDPSRRKSAARIAPSTWEEYESVIRRLHFDKYTADEILQILRERYSFSPSIPQLRKQLARWKLRTSRVAESLLPTSNAQNASLSQSHDLSQPTASATNQQQSSFDSIDKENIASTVDAGTGPAIPLLFPNRGQTQTGSRGVAHNHPGRETAFSLDMLHWPHGSSPIDLPFRPTSPNLDSFFRYLPKGNTATSGPGQNGQLPKPTHLGAEKRFEGADHTAHRQLQQSPRTKVRNKFAIEEQRGKIFRYQVQLSSWAEERTLGRHNVEDLSHSPLPGPHDPMISGYSQSDTASSFKRFRRGGTPSIASSGHRSKLSAGGIVGDEHEQESFESVMGIQSDGFDLPGESTHQNSLSHLGVWA